MAVIDYKAANMNVLKKQCKALNDSGLLPEPIEIRVGLKKQDLADTFVKAIETCSDINKLDDIPEEVYTFYTSIVLPDSAAPAAGAAEEEAATATPATGKGRGAAAKTAPKKAAPKKAAPKKAAAAPAAPRVTRAAVFAGIIKDGKPRTKKQIVDEMQAQYGGSTKEAPFWVNGYCSLLLAMGNMVKNADDTLVYMG